MGSEECATHRCLTCFLSYTSRLARFACALVFCAVANAAHADAPQPARSPPATLDRPFAIASYTAGWLGSYSAIGVGGRVRVEPFSMLGVEVFGEAVGVDWSGAFRHDWQIGFDLYVPLRLASDVRLRPMFGFCSVFSFIEPPTSNAPRADDILFGAHVGLGLEGKLSDDVSAFVETHGVGWAGHARNTRAWTAGIEDSYTFFTTLRVLLGLTWHIDVS